LMARVRCIAGLTNVADASGSVPVSVDDFAIVADFQLESPSQRDRGFWVHALGDIGRSA